MKKLLALAAAGEGITGLALLVVPSIVVRLLLGAELSGVTVPVARVAGLALVSLSVACYPGEAASGRFWGMVTYSLLAALYLVYLGLGGEWVGSLLWPAAAIHAALTFLFVIAWLKDRQVKGRKGYSD